MKKDELEELLAIVQKLDQSVNYFDIEKKDPKKKAGSVNVCTATFFDPGPSLRPEEIPCAISRANEILVHERKARRIAEARKILREEGVGMGDESEDGYDEC